MLEKEYQILNNFKEFIRDFKVSFRDTNNILTTINKIRRLRQGDRLASTYAADFRLLNSDIPWDDQALIEQFHYGLRNDIKNLLLTFLKEPKSLTEAISRTVRCNNRLLKRRSERQFQMPMARSQPTYASMVAKPRSEDNPRSMQPISHSIPSKHVSNVFLGQVTVSTKSTSLVPL